MPAEQTAIVRHEADETRVVSLWPVAAEGRDDGTATEAFLHVHTRDGERRIACSRVRVLTVEPAKTVRLSPLLRRALSAFPHVVGMTLIEDELTWLVDVGRVPLLP